MLGVLRAFLDGPKWVLAFEATPEELAEVKRLLGEPYSVASTATVSISKEPDGSFSARSGGTFQGELRGKTLEDLVEQGRTRLWFRAADR